MTQRTDCSVSPFLFDLVFWRPGIRRLLHAAVPSSGLPIGGMLSGVENPFALLHRVWVSPVLGMGIEVVTGLADSR